MSSLSATHDNMYSTAVGADVWTDIRMSVKNSWLYFIHSLCEITHSKLMSNILRHSEMALSHLSIWHRAENVLQWCMRGLGIPWECGSTLSASPSVQPSPSLCTIFCCTWYMAASNNAKSLAPAAERYQACMAQEPKKTCPYLPCSNCILALLFQCCSFL